MYRVVLDCFLLIFIILFFSIPGIAGPPDAGQILREQQPRLKFPDQLPSPEKKEEKTPAGKSGIRITVKGFTFSGYQGLVPLKDLQLLVADAVGRDLTFADLQEKVTLVTRYLKEQGWLLARAYLPEQDISSGQIRIAVVQGNSDGTLNIQGDETLRINPDRLRRIGANSISPGQPLNRRDLERAVLLMNDLPGVSAKVALSAGRKPGTTALTFKAAEGPLFTGAAWADNYGNRYTGAARLNGMLDVNDLSGIGDRIRLLATGAQDLATGEIGYSVPLLPNGLRGNISTTFLKYDLGKEFSDLGADGDAFTVKAGVSYPWLRSRKTNMTVFFDYEYKALSDAVTGIDTDDKTLHSGTAGLRGNHYDSFLGGGLTHWNTTITAGHMNEKIADIEITGTEGGYAFLNLGLGRLQRLSRQWTLKLSWQAQFSRNNLDSSEQFSLGGPYGIRAYPVSEGMGDQGHLFNLGADMVLPIPERYGKLKWQLFYDAGYITLHKDPWTNSITTKTGKNRYWLQGAGTGLEYGYDDKFLLQALWAHTIGDNDGCSTSGDDSDGHQNDNRFWVQAVLRF